MGGRAKDKKKLLYDYINCYMDNKIWTVIVVI